MHIATLYMQKKGFDLVLELYVHSSIFTSNEICARSPFQAGICVESQQLEDVRPRRGTFTMSLRCRLNLGSTRRGGGLSAPGMPVTVYRPDSADTAYGDRASWMQLEKQYPMFILASDSTEISNSE